MKIVFKICCFIFLITQTSCLDVMWQYKFYIPLDYFSYSSRIDRALQDQDFASVNDLLKEMSSEELANVWYETYGLDAPLRVKDSPYSIEVEKAIYTLSNYLISENEDNKETTQMIISLLNLWRHPAHKIGCFKEYDPERKYNKYYNQSVCKYNALIKDIIDRSISVQNLELGYSLVNLIKPTLAEKEVESHWFHQDIFEFSYDYSAKEKIEAIIQSQISKFTN